MFWNLLRIAGLLSSIPAERLVEPPAAGLLSDIPVILRSAERPVEPPAAVVAAVSMS